MKTAVSIPDKIFKSAEKLARRRGVSRSRLYADALVRFIQEQDQNAITERLNEVYSQVSSELDPAMRAAARATFIRNDW